MSEHSQEEISKHVRTYISVFAALAALTIITVAISYLHLSTGLAIAVALFVATIKGSLVVAYFMHLISEAKIIRYILILTAIFFLVLLLLPAIGHF
ncbi:MAG: hypothetical protein EXS63_00100 [Candidatus Omnitrophica bacterium]|nr:hypothetical protein [Candidatus Omnitrophota bacterium]